MARRLSEWECFRLVAQRAVICPRNTIYKSLTENATSLIGKPVFLVHRTEQVLESGLEREQSIVMFDAPKSLEELLVEIRMFEITQEFKIVLGWEREWTAFYIDAMVLPIWLYIPHRIDMTVKKLGKRLLQAF